MQGSDQPTLSLPDHTRIQIVAVIQAMLATAVAFGVPISDDQSVALLALAAVLGTMLIGADAAIRRERARNADKLLPKASVERTTTDAEGETTVGSSRRWRTRGTRKSTRRSSSSSVAS